MSVPAFRLPTDVIPRRYDIALEARIGSDAFNGSMVLALDIARPSQTITLHARDLLVSDVRLECDGQVLAGTVELDTLRELAVLSFERPLPAGPASLALAFGGQLNPGLCGLYLAQDGPEQLLCTQCEATDARAIFPCFDEPEFKARFAYAITTTPHATVLTNTPLLSVTDHPERSAKTWRFAVSKPMSTYLVALVIGDIAGTEAEVVAGTPVRVWALRGKEHLGAFAHAYTTRLLPWYEAYFDVPYHYDKYDQVATPGFAAGAMENCGLVLFRQSLLLMDPGTSSWDDEKWIALVVAHEFAHMWFGNLVTMRWWDDLWLNEAFAEWIANKAVNELSPDYRIWNDFQLGKNAALATDALESTHPIYSPVQTPAEANELFDVITYQKGSAVLRMLEHFLGADAFRSGLRTYMREFAERNAAGADLWRHLQQAADVPVEAIMKSWILQNGYPLISIAAAGNGGTALQVSQRRFFSSPGAAAEPQLWQVPLVIRYADDRGTHETRFLLTEREASVPLDVSGTLRWCYANASEIGFYRQHLQNELVDRLREHLHELAPSEQLGLLNDQWALTRNGTQTLTAFLDVLAALATVNHYHVLREVLSHLHTLDSLIEDTGDEQARDSFRAWVGRTFREQLTELGFEPRAGEGQLVTQQRISIVDAMLTLAEDAAAREQAEQWVEREAADPAAVDPNLAPLFISATARFGDAQRFRRYVDLYRQRREAGSAPQETERYLYSLVEFRPAELVCSTLDLIDEKVLPQEAIGPILRVMLYHRHAQLQAWQYIKDNWETITGLGLFWFRR